MLCYGILYHVISFQIILNHIISYYIILYHIISYYLVIHHGISYYIIVNQIISCYTIVNHIIYIILCHIITYLPHKAVAEVSKDKEPIGRECAEFNWFESQLMSDSNELRVKWFGCHLIWDSNDFGCHLIWDSNDLVVNRCVLQMILVVCWFELQVMWLSIDFRFKWFGWQLIWDSRHLVVNRFEIQMSWLSADLRFKRVGSQMIWGSSDSVVNWCVIQMILSDEAFLQDFLQNCSFEAQKRSFSARLLSKKKFWSSKTKLFCEIPFKNEALKLKNEAFLRDSLQKWRFEDQKRSFSARLPSKLKLWRSKTKHFCETSFKNDALKLKNEAFVQDFLQKWRFEDQKRSFSARLPSKTKLWNSKTKLLCETSFKNEALKIKNEPFVRDFLQKWQVDQTLDLRIPIRFNDF